MGNSSSVCSWFQPVEAVADSTDPNQTEKEIYPTSNSSLPLDQTNTNANLSILSALPHAKTGQIHPEPSSTPTSPFFPLTPTLTPAAQRSFYSVPTTPQLRSLLPLIATFKSETEIVEEEGKKDRKDSRAKKSSKLAHCDKEESIEEIERKDSERRRKELENERSDKEEKREEVEHPIPPFNFTSTTSEEKSSWVVGSSISSGSFQPSDWLVRQQRFLAERTEWEKEKASKREKEEERRKRIDRIKEKPNATSPHLLNKKKWNEKQTEEKERMARIVARIKQTRTLNTNNHSNNQNSSLLENINKVHVRSKTDTRVSISNSNNSFTMEEKVNQHKNSFLPSPSPSSFPSLSSPPLLLLALPPTQLSDLLTSLLEPNSLVNTPNSVSPIPSPLTLVDLAFQSRVTAHTERTNLLETKRRKSVLATEKSRTSIEQIKNEITKMKAEIEKKFNKKTDLKELLRKKKKITSQLANIDQQNKISQDKEKLRAENELLALLINMQNEEEKGKTEENKNTAA